MGLIFFFMVNSLTNNIFTCFHGLLDLERLFSETFYLKQQKELTSLQTSTLSKLSLKPLTYLTNREDLWLIWYL